MRAPNLSAQDELANFEARNTPEGLFLRYARARIRDFKSRQVLTVGGSLALAWLVSPLFGALVAMLVLLGEGVDCFALYRLSRNDAPPANLLKSYRITTATAAFQSITYGACVLLTWYATPDGSTHFYAVIFLTGAAINAGIVRTHHRQASTARLTILVAVGIWLSLSDLRMSFHVGHFPGFDTLATVMLAYMTYMFLNFTSASFYRRQASDRNMLVQKQELAQVHAALIEKELHTRNLALVAQSANDIVIISGEDRAIEWVNPAFTKITGYTREEAIGQEVSPLLNGPKTDPKTIELISQSIANHQSIRTEIQNHTKAGGTIWVETNITPIISADGSIVKVISVERDITLVKERERELAQAMIAAEEGARTKANFLATMSHEIRTPLNGIIGMADLLKQTNLRGDQEKYTDTIQSSGEALLRIINDILDLSKLDAGGIKALIEPFSLSRCLRDSITLLEPLAEEKGLKISLIYPLEELDRFQGDVGHIRQVVINLIGNAIKFTPSGRVQVAVEIESKGTKNRIEIKVSDSGIGIADDALSRIFDVFSQAEEDTTRNYGGTGLGLTISRKFAQEMGGDITVTSVLGEGSCFTLSLNLASAETVNPKTVKTTNAPSNQSDLRDKRILIAEDNGTNRLLIRKMLERHADHLRFANDGIDVVEQYKEHAPELVLMDVSMPKQNGLQATRCIRKLEETSGNRAIIIALTANAFESDKEECMKAGMDGFLTKPVKMKELLQSVSFHLSQQ